ncbi:MAG TPA: TIGR02679 family protein [Clostridiaceae bacterium]|nr:TIGR02679 family protein [Clostridiaceae bacterium]
MKNERMKYEYINNEHMNREHINDKRLLDECTSYFRQNKGFTRIFEKIKEKYRSLGVIGGTVKLSNLTAHEQEALTGFLRKDYLGKKSAAIKLLDFQKALDNTKFAGIGIEELLNAYFGEAILSKRSEQKLYEERRNMFFSSIIDLYKDTPAGKWLKYVFDSQENAYRAMIQKFDTDNDKLRSDIVFVCNAINNLPVYSNKKVRLPVFASAIAKNPHVFDENTFAGQLLLFALCYTYGVPKPANTEEKAELLYEAGILFDEVSNFVLCAGLLGYKNNNVHPGWGGFSSLSEPVQATLLNLSRLDRVKSPSKKVFVVENPSVFLTILDVTPFMNVPVICTYGQLKLACFILLDMLAKVGTTIYYSGDFDPEGLLIADRLKSRYQDRLKLWRYTVEDYLSALSNNILSPVRLKKLDNLKDPGLATLAQEIKQKKLAGYQELISDKLINDISGTFR